MLMRIYGTSGVGVGVVVLTLFCRPVPVAAAGTTFLNHASLLTGREDPDWFEENIAFLDVPDVQIQAVYYYRCQTYKEHLVYTGAQYGYMASEFLHPVDYGAPYGGVVAAAGHHINEGRWLRNYQYGQDIANYWLAGPGTFSKPTTDNVNADTTDWAHEYSFWAASALWRQYLTTGDRDFVVGQLENLVKQYRGWDNHFNSAVGLYWQAPVWDATEYTAASYESSDPYHGGAGYRPTINSYQYGDARAIAAIAALAGDPDRNTEYTQRADALQKTVQQTLWDMNSRFYKHQARDNNPSGALLTTREIMGYLPWMFNLPTAASHTAAFAQLKDPQGFSASYGPTTAERRSKWYLHEATTCCRWDGPSWPFATSQTLTAVENLLNDYPAQTYFSAADYISLLRGYAATQYKNGQPYVAEAHDPDADAWMSDYDRSNHSEDYNHSTFVDNIIAGLIGLRVQRDDSLVVNPLAPPSWDHFALENAAYHGHNVTVLWDSTGSHYGQGQGLRVYVDGTLAGSRSTLGSLTVNVGPVVLAQTMPSHEVVNIAANGQKFHQGTTPSASYTSPYDDVWRAIDGIVWRTGIPENSRWTSYGSPNARDYFAIDLRRPQAVSDVRLYFYDDGGGVRRPASYDLQYWPTAGGNASWLTVPNQQRSSGSAHATTSNSQTKITFPTIVTSQLRVVAPNNPPGAGNGWGLSEFEVWTPAVFQLRNENSGKLMGVDGSMSTANSANIQQYDDNGTRDHLWQFVRAPGGWFKIRNLNSGLLLGVQGASTANSAVLQQYEDNGTSDHLWRVILSSQGRNGNGNGLFLLKNKNSGLLAGVDGMSTANGANIVQFEDNGTKDHLWSILPAVPAS